MNDPHRIRLRGGWTLVADGAPRPWSLPCTGESLAEVGPVVTLMRRYNHPPIRDGKAICRLVLRRVAGVVDVLCDGARFTPMAPVVDHPEAGFDFELPDAPGHRLELSVDTSAAREAADWGEIYLEIEEIQ
jgi:hypothetical protein